MSSVVILPQFSLEVDRQALPQDVVGTLEEIQVQRRLSQPSRCELTFRAARERLFDCESICQQGARGDALISVEACVGSRVGHGYRMIVSVCGANNIRVKIGMQYYPGKKTTTWQSSEYTFRRCSHLIQSNV